MQMLVSVIEGKVHKPKPINKFSDRDLEREVEQVQRLLAQARDANLRHFERIQMELKAAAANRVPPDSPRVTRLTTTHGYVVSDALRERLALRLRVCRTELSRRRMKLLIKLLRPRRRH